LLLENACRGHSTVTCPNAPKTRQRAQNRVNLFLARLATANSTSSRPSSAAKRPWASSRQASHHIGHLDASIATARPKAPDRDGGLAGSNSAWAHTPALADRAAFKAASNAGT